MCRSASVPPNGSELTTPRRRRDDDTTTRRRRQSKTTRTQVQPQTPTINGNPSLRIRKKHQKLPDMKGTNTYDHSFFDQFSRKSGKRLWRYVMLCGAMFQTVENRQKLPNMKGINTYDPFFDQVSRKSGKRLWRYVALCGAMWRYFSNIGKSSKNAKHEGDQYI